MKPKGPSSPQPPQPDTVPAKRRVSLIRCPNCDALHIEGIPPGYHAPHWVRGRLLNCVDLPLGKLKER